MLFYWFIVAALFALIVGSAVYTIRTQGWWAMLPPLPPVAHVIIWLIKKGTTYVVPRRF